MQGWAAPPPPAPFIVGVPRSGTTLLRLMLGAHPELAIPPETGWGLVAPRIAAEGGGPADLTEALRRLPTWVDVGFTAGSALDVLARTLR